jgi:hypothetical protein
MNGTFSRWDNKKKKRSLDKCEIAEKKAEFKSSDKKIPFLWKISKRERNMSLTHSVSQ